MKKRGELPTWATWTIGIVAVIVIACGGWYLVTKWGK